MINQLDLASQAPVRKTPTKTMMTREPDMISRSVLLTNLFILIPLAMLGMMAGFFYSYSVSVMPGLNHAQPKVAIAAMQSLNVTIRNPTFFVTFFLTIPVGLLGALLLWRCCQKRASIWLALAILIYLFGAVIPTGVINVPMNDALGQQRIPTDLGAALELWKSYAPEWTFWNTFRTVTTMLALLTCACAISQLKSASERVS